MEKGYFLALLLAAAVVAITQILFPAGRSTPAVGPKSDTATAVTRLEPRLERQQSQVVPRVQAARNDSISTSLSTAELTTVVTPRSVYRFSNIGAVPVSVALKEYKNLAPAGGAVELGVPGQPLLRYALVVNGDTTWLDGFPFRSRVFSNQVTYDAVVANHNVEISYEIQPDKYVVKANGKVEGADQNTYLLIQLPTS